MIWEETNRADQFAREIADRHYNRQSIGSAQFVPPGRCLVLKARTVTGIALWVTSWPFAEYVKHAWGGAWVCSAFRNEGCARASELILQAVSATRAKYPETPAQGMITFINRAKVRPVMVRGLQTWGRTFAMCGFEHVGETKGGLMAWRLPPERMPPAVPALNTQASLFG